jgi:large subunit ribosomal protein L21
MYAIFETGGKQYKVAAGDVLRVEKLSEEPGAKIKIDKVLAVNDGKRLQVGNPYLDAAIVNATVLSNGKRDKVIIFKYKAKKDYRKKQGHRQSYTEIEIQSFAVDGKTIAKKVEKKVVKKEKPAVDTTSAVAEAEEEAVNAADAVAEADGEATETAAEVADKPEKTEAAAEVADKPEKAAAQKTVAERKPATKKNTSSAADQPVSDGRDAKPKTARKTTPKSADAPDEPGVTEKKTAAKKSAGKTVAKPDDGKKKPVKGEKAEVATDPENADTEK